MKGWRIVLVVLLITVVLAFCWWLAGALGLLVTVQESGGWSDPTGPIDFAAELGEAALFESFPVDAEVDNVILLLADGMGLSHVTAARSQLVGINRRLTFERFPVVSWTGTHSLAELGTDSAAGATALATGVKTYQGALAVDARGAPLRTIFEAAQEAGAVTGFVTDSYFLDASPSAFSIHHPDRGDYAEIAEKMPRSGNEVMIGELGEEYPKGEAARESLYRSFRDAGYVVATSAVELRRLGASGGSPIAGFFEVGVIADAEIEPTLAQLFDLALERLSANPGGFILLAETEDPDSGSHDGDFGQVLRGVSKLEKMTKRAVSFARSNGRTLVLVVSDHETGGLTLTGGDGKRPLGLRWASTSHTGVPVPLYAFGPGAERFSGVRDNTEVAPTLAGLLGLELAPVSNPEPGY